MKRIFFVLMLMLQLIIYSQTNYELFPSNLNIQPYTANFLEPKVGFLFQTGGNKIRLDIGNSLDVIHYKISEYQTVSGGIDFFTFTYLYGEKDFHFPVDAVDYLFGINLGFKQIREKDEFGLRFRFSHISAHFVDGHRDNINDKWKDDINPIVYSREFIELLPYYKIQNLRLYLGMTYLYHVDPTTIGKEIYQGGFDYFMKNFINEDFTPFIAYDFKIQRITEYKVNSALSVGIKIGKPNSKGLSIYYHYYNGKNIHGEYYFMDEKFSSIGFNLDL
ncbi:MAG TPA: DUF1207 domain-containing protein [Melioribacteraceae bacterium]|nr:DUF1207 domain-containing protein [Melioribacteraceae bacterium]